jgi:hypothetical protein
MLLFWCSGTVSKCIGVQGDQIITFEYPRSIIILSIPSVIVLDELGLMIRIFTILSDSVSFMMSMLRLSYLGSIVSCPMLLSRCWSEVIRELPDKIKYAAGCWIINKEFPTLILEGKNKIEVHLRRISWPKS